MQLVAIGFLLVVVLCPLVTNSIRCYKCDASDQCRSIQHGYMSKDHDDPSDSLEIIDCEHYCWKSVSLGKTSRLTKLIAFLFSRHLGNVYRGCARKRCAVSHALGAFSSSACCQTDYCNQSTRLSISLILLLLLHLICFACRCCHWDCSTKTRLQLLLISFDTHLFASICPTEPPVMQSMTTNSQRMFFVDMLFIGICLNQW